MDEKKAYEAFRVRKFAQPHPALLNNSTYDSDDDDKLGAEDDFAQDQGDAAQAPCLPNGQQRVILHFDCDCFYAQVEEVRNPALRQLPLGVTQKYLIVTCNYLARAAGVTKLMGIQEAMARCPELVLVSGEDLGPYRQASKSIHAVLSRYGPAERLGMDETFVDATEEVQRRIRSGAFEHPAAPPRLVGHVHTARCAVAADTSYRPQDLRAVLPAAAAATAAGPAADAAADPSRWVSAQSPGGSPGVAAGATGGVATEDAGGSTGAGAGAATAAGGDGDRMLEGLELLLTVGSMVAAEARAAVRSETGFRSSAGIAHNKMLAKLVSGLHKPDDQTVLMPGQAFDFVGPLPVRALPGVGYKTEKMLTEGLGVATAGELRRYSQAQLVDKLGDKTGVLVWHLCRGLDPSPVRPTGPPRSITVEDSFKSCTSWSGAAAVLRVLAPDLLQRLHEEYDENRRRPETLTLKWRLRGTGWSRSSASCAMPLPPGSLAAPPSQAQVDLLVRSALHLLQKQLREPFNLSLINIGATNFKVANTAGATGGTILDLFSRRNGRPPGSSAGGASTATARALTLDEIVAPSPEGDLGLGCEQLVGELTRQGARDRSGNATNGHGGRHVSGWVSSDGFEDAEQEQAEVGLGEAHGLGPERRQHAAGPGAGAGAGGGSRVRQGEGGGGALSPEEARRAAAVSAALRRDYRGSDQEQAPVILSKSRERQLREAAARVLPQQSPLAGPRPAAGHSPRAGPHPQLHRTSPEAHHNQRNLNHHSQTNKQQQQQGSGQRQSEQGGQLQPGLGRAGSAAGILSATATGPPPPRLGGGGNVARGPLGADTGSPVAGVTNGPLPGAADGAAAATREPRGSHPRPEAGEGASDGCDTYVGPPPRAKQARLDPELPQRRGGVEGGSPGEAVDRVPEPVVAADGHWGTQAVDLDAAVVGYRVMELYDQDLPYDLVSDEDLEGGAAAAFMGEHACGWRHSDGGSSSDGGGIASLPCGWDDYTWETCLEASEEAAAPAPAPLADLFAREGASWREAGAGAAAASPMLAAVRGGTGPGPPSAAATAAATASALLGEEQQQHHHHVNHHHHGQQRKRKRGRADENTGAPGGVADAERQEGEEAEQDRHGQEELVLKKRQPGEVSWLAAGGRPQELRQEPGDCAPGNEVAALLQPLSAGAAGGAAGRVMAGPQPRQQAGPTHVELRKQSPSPVPAQQERHYEQHPPPPPHPLPQPQQQLEQQLQTHHHHKQQPMWGMAAGSESCELDNPTTRSSHRALPGPTGPDRDLLPQHQYQRQQQQQQQRGGRVFLHVDIDCFYCQVERLDEPSLVGVPLAVTQFNSGGFVAVSYEARAAGIRCGDGVGAGGRASIPYLKAMGAVSISEAQRRCPGLVVRPMRTERYRRVAEQVHAMLRRFAPDGQVEKTSYDDFYLDITAACGAAHTGAGAGVHAICDGSTKGAAGASTGGSGGGADAAAAVPAPATSPSLAASRGSLGSGCGGPSGGLGLGRADGDDADGEAPLEPMFYMFPGQYDDPDGVGGSDDDLDVEREQRGAGLQQERRGQAAHAGPAEQRMGPQPPRVHVAGGGVWVQVEPWLKQGVEVAQQLRAALNESLLLTASVGVAPTKLSARLAGPANKPDAITVVPAARLRDFMAGVRIKSVPTLAGKTGNRVVSELGVELVGQLAAWPRRELVSRFGAEVGGLLAELPTGGPVGGSGGGGGGGATGGAVRERGPQKSILVERSFPPITRFGGVKEALVPMVGSLWERVVEDAVANRRAPNKLLLTWRQGYGAPKTRSSDVSVQALQALKAATAAAAAKAASGPAEAPGPAPPASTPARPPSPNAAPAAIPAVDAGGGVAAAASEGCWMEAGAVPSYTYQGCRALLEGAAAIFKQGLGNLRNAMQITRLAVAVGFGASDGADASAGQRSISDFTKQHQQHQPQAQPDQRAPRPQPQPQPQQQQQQQQQPQLQLEPHHQKQQQFEMRQDLQQQRRARAPRGDAELGRPSVFAPVHFGESCPLAAAGGAVAALDPRQLPMPPRVPLPHATTGGLPSLGCTAAAAGIVGTASGGISGKAHPEASAPCSAPDRSYPDLELDLDLEYELGFTDLVVPSSDDTARGGGAGPGVLDQEPGPEDAWDFSFVS